ncbi:MAG: MarR family transcriptional regulator [bacterium]|nr:MarR family transcriptional regulator [bacterium]
MSIKYITVEDLSNITTYQAGTIQAHVHRALQKRCDEILAPFGITKMHWMIIGNVMDAGSKGVRVSDLAEKLGTTISYLTTNVNLLEKTGFLLRTDNKEDSRSKYIKVMPNQLAKCRKIEKTLREDLRKTIYATIDPDEFRIYMKVMYQLKSVNKQSATKY